MPELMGARLQPPELRDNFLEAVQHMQMCISALMTLGKTTVQPWSAPWARHRLICGDGYGINAEE